MHTSIKKLLGLALTLTICFHVHGMEIPQQEYSEAMLDFIVRYHIKEKDLYPTTTLLIKLGETCKKFRETGTLDGIKKTLQLDQKALDDNLLIYGAYFKSSDNLIPFFRLLIEMGARMDRYSQNLISYVNATHHAYLVRHFINNYDNKVNQQDENGDTPLHHAIQANKVDVVLLLLEYNANMYIKNKNGYTAIIKALLYNHIECLKALQKYGLDTSIKYKVGIGYELTIAEWADRTHNEEIYRLITNQKIPTRWYESCIIQ